MNKYEISLWEDYPDIKNNISFLNERKLCVIGSDSMKIGARAVEPRMTSNVNGSNTFTFKMLYNYVDEITGENYKNPFLPLLVNERKVKVFWEDKWYDLVIKNIDEDSTGKSVVYTCQDLCINELGKNGYNLAFTSELQNNIGTAADLTKQVLEGSGWFFDEENSTHIIQKTEEPVYEIKTSKEVKATLQSPDGDKVVTIPKNKTILVFYSSIIDITNTATIVKDIQFLYSKDGYQTDENEMLVTNGDCYIASLQVKKNGSYIECRQNNTLRFKINTDSGISTKYRANRLVKSQTTAYDKLLDRYVELYLDTITNKEVYGYQTYDFTDPLSVVNLIVNSSNFKNLDGWIGTDLIFGVFPKFTIQTDISQYKGTSYLRVTSGNIYNYAFSSNKQYLVPTQGEIQHGELGGFHIGDKYIFRVKFKKDSDDPSTTEYIHTNSIIQPLISTFDINYAPSSENYFSINKISNNGDWTEYTLICIKSCPASEIEKIGLFLQISTACWIENIEFFKYATGIKSYDSTIEERINPGEISLQGIEKIKYRYYDKDQNVTKPEELEFLYQGETDSNRFLPIYNNYEKMTSIEVSNSNRFNILQSIAETYQCWIQFNIKHEQNGKIKLNEDGSQQKYITLVESIGKDLGWSFEYSIDLKGIKRKIISNDLATKIIVLPNNNMSAQNGTCSIAKSELNYIKENFILNLDYYVNQGLLDKDTLDKDLYSTSSNYLRYYYLLHQYNTEYDKITNILVQKQIELVKQRAQLTVLQEKNKAAQKQRADIQSDIIMLAGVLTWEEAQSYVQTHSDNVKVQSLMNSLSQVEKDISNNIYQLEELESSITILETKIEQDSNRQEELIQNVKDLHELFFKKYSRFIQEGTWQDENYIDDNKYYLDAMEVAYTSSRPQLQYQIDVMRLNSLEEFSSKKFNIGDICYVLDREFFGYNADKITPYKLKITISEITSFFDQPEKSTIKVQNYKTQFDDLFQRITATTQSLQYSQGSYQKAAGAINTDGTFNFELLQNTFDNNQNLVLNASNQQVVWDSTGITVTDNTNAAQKVKLMSGGLFITNDGGASWKNAVRGDGISTDILTAGKINTNEIYIYDGDAPSFRWDSNGLTAYSYDGNSINFNRFIRYDRYGIYGYDGNVDFVPVSESDIWDTANFGLTWSGFFLRSKNENNNTFFEISTDRDLIIKNGNINRVQIGRLDESGTNYGLQLRNNNGDLIFSVDNDGARIGGWEISSEGFVDPVTGDVFSMNKITFGEIEISNDGIKIPDVNKLKVNNQNCESNNAPILDINNQFTGEMTWTENGTTHSNISVTITVDSNSIKNIISY